METRATACNSACTRNRQASMSVHAISHAPLFILPSVSSVAVSNRWSSVPSRRAFVPAATFWYKIGGTALHEPNVIRAFFSKSAPLTHEHVHRALFATGKPFTQRSFAGGWEGTCDVGFELISGYPLGIH